MDSVQIIALASAIFGFGVGYVLAYILTRRDLIGDVTMRINVMRRWGPMVADANKGEVPWSAIEARLVEFPGQERSNR